MSTEEYKRKRDFKRSPEPRPQRHQRPASAPLTFVVHKHHARRPHYDLRLELAGVLKSWAVPKGPSCDPGERRLAVEVEDHPLSYRSFEGLIPAGEYGAGPVMIWDEGTWSPEGDAARALADGKLEFSLSGQRLRGRWRLVRLLGRPGEKQPQWLLIKRQDAAACPEQEPPWARGEPRSVKSGRTIAGIAANEPPLEGLAQTAELDPVALPGARPGRLPARFSPQLATGVEIVPHGDSWLHEIKLDGYRIIARLSGGRVQLFSRRGHDWTRKFPGVAAALSALPLTEAIFDGEVAVLRQDGTTDFEALQNALHGDDRQVIYHLFDLPFGAGQDLSRTPLEERKALLRAVLQAGGPPPQLRFSDHIVGQGPAILQEACRRGVEGIVAKERQSGYHQRRTHHWLKVKCHHQQEFVVGGYTLPRGSRLGLGALLLGTYDPQGRLAYRGAVGSGFSRQVLGELHSALELLERPKPPFGPPPPRQTTREARWVEPQLVVEVRFGEWTKEGLIRHGSFLGQRHDLDPRQVRLELPARLPTTTTGGAPPSGNNDRRGSRQAQRISGVRVTHPDRLLYPGANLTKVDLIRYYQQIAPLMLPHVAKRPLALVRCPEGQDRPCFFQKHLTESLPAAVRTVEIRAQDGTSERYLFIQPEVAGLTALAQLGSLEIHSWGSRIDRPELPDRLVVDLDPGPDAPWAQLIQAAHEVRERLERLGLRSFVKTTGGKGLHVVAPLVRRASWEEVKSFCRALVTRMARDQPERYTTSMRKANRPGKIYLDYLRNSQGATSVAPYSTRAHPLATVSLPLPWPEITPALDPQAFTARTVPARLAQAAANPWEDLERLRQTLTKKMRAALGS